MSSNTALQIYRGMQVMVAVVMVTLGMLGFLVKEEGNGLPAGAVIQSGSVITGNLPGNFNDDVKIDSTHVEVK